MIRDNIRSSNGSRSLITSHTTNIEIASIKHVLICQKCNGHVLCMAIENRINGYWSI